MIRPCDAILRALKDEARAHGPEFLDAYIAGRLAALVECFYDRGETMRCVAVEMARELEAAGRAALESESAR